KGFHGLTRNAAVAAGLNKSNRCQNGNDISAGDWLLPEGQRHQAALLKESQDGEESSLGIQRVENGFDQQQIRPAIEQSPRLIIVSRGHFIERGPSRPRVVNVGRDRGRLGGWSDGAGDKTGAPRMPLHYLVGGAAGAFGSGLGKFVTQAFHSVIRQ